MGRKSRLVSVQFAVVTLLQIVASSAENCKLVDLSYTYANNITYLPQYPAYQFTVLHRGTQNGYWLELNQIKMVEHSGTHMDAPRHFKERGLTVDEMPLREFIAPGVVVDIKKKAEKDPNVKLAVEDLQDWEKDNGRIPPRAVVLVNSGWGKKMFNRTAYLGITRSGPPGDFNFPGIKANAIHWLIDERDIAGVGVDTLSIDGGKLRQAEAHRTLLGRDKYALENVANINKLPPRGFTLLAFPIGIGGGSGAPTRLVAVQGDCGDLHSGAQDTQLHFSYFTMLLSPFLVWIAAN